MSGVEVGDQAPDFTLPGVQGSTRRDYTLSEYRGRKVVLASAYEDDETLKRMTNEGFAGIMASEDTKEGLTAFIEKRLPNWQAK